MSANIYEVTGTESVKCPFDIYVDQAGYEPEDIKRAAMHFPGGAFRVTDEQGTVFFEGETTAFGYDEAAGEDVWIADFSGLRREGSYRVLAGEGRSATFRIAGDAHRKVFDDTVFAYYFLRCGCGLDEEHAGVYRHGPCHTGMAQLWEDRSAWLDVSGGWHDAGDYGRYVTAGACALAHLLYAFRLFPAAFEKQGLPIPEAGNGMPNILSECRVELEWLLKMQREDGAVYHKATTANHAPFVMPEEDRAQMYVLPVSTMATADLAAVCALAARIYEGYDADFAGRLRGAALKTGEWLADHPEFIGFRNPEGCNTGWYGEWDDLSNRFWAWAELYGLTGEECYHERMKAALERKQVLPPMPWQQKSPEAGEAPEEKDFPRTALGYAEVGGFGAMAYLFCERRTEAALREYFKGEFVREGERLRAVSEKCGYGCAMTKYDYYWGSNMGLMQKGMIFALCDVLEEDAGWRPCAAAQLHTLLGVNALGYSYVTGCGEFCCRNPHLRPAFADGVEECMPGMVSGGPNSVPADPPGKLLVPEGTPPMKCYADHAGCYSLNEITIYWNSPTVFVLAYLLRDAE